MTYRPDDVILLNDDRSASIDAHHIGGPDEVMELTLSLIKLRSKMLGRVPSGLINPDPLTASRALLDVVLDRCLELQAEIERCYDATEDGQITQHGATMRRLRPAISNPRARA